MKLRALLTLCCLGPVMAFAQASTNIHAARCGGQPIAPSDFVEVRESVAKRSAESDQLQVAKNITDHQCFTCDEVVVIMRIFSTEATRLEYAKYAYDHVVDQQNYVKVASILTNAADKQDLTSFTRNR